MSGESLFRFLLHSYLNPLLLLVYLLAFRRLFSAFQVNAFISVGINSERLNVVWYLLLAPLLYLAWLVTDLLFLRSFNESLTLSSMLSVELHWLQFLSVAAALFTLLAYSGKSGMEGNIMGFIFAPLLLVGILVDGFFHCYWIWSDLLKGGVS